MFHFPAFPPHSLYIQLQVTPHNMVRGSPIRKSWPQRPVIDSTRLIADSHVLHRLLMPRHPPCALKNFNTKQSSQKLSYKTINKITTNKTQTPHTPRTGTHSSSCLQDARVHYTVPKQQPRTPATTPQNQHQPKASINPTGHPCSKHRTNTETPRTPHPSEHHQDPPHRKNPGNHSPGKEACCLKTQQHAKPYKPHNTHTPHSSTARRKPPAMRTSRCPSTTRPQPIPRTSISQHVFRY